MWVVICAYILLKISGKTLKKTFLQFSLYKRYFTWKFWVLKVTECFHSALLSQKIKLFSHDISAFIYLLKILGSCEERWKVSRFGSCWSCSLAGSAQALTCATVVCSRVQVSVMSYFKCGRFSDLHFLFLQPDLTGIVNRMIIWKKQSWSPQITPLNLASLARKQIVQIQIRYEFIHVSQLVNWFCISCQLDLVFGPWVNILHLWHGLVLHETHTMCG